VSHRERSRAPDGRSQRVQCTVVQCARGQCGPLLVVPYGLGEVLSCTGTVPDLAPVGVG
jgi:hypothetical protein